MTNWAFNKDLLSMLSDVLDLSFAEISRRVGLKQQVMNRYTKDEINISIQTVLKICNKLCIPLQYFVSIDGVSVIPQREYATLPRNEWRPVDFNRIICEDLFGPNKIHWKDVGETMGAKSQNAHKRFKLKTRFPVDDFFTTCTSFQISPFLFFIDYNTIKEGGESKETRKPDNPQAQPDIQDLQKRLGELERRVEHTDAQYKTLLQKYNKLERLYNSLAHDSGTFLLQAAEQSETYDGSKKK